MYLYLSIVHSCYFRALRLGGVLTSPQAATSGLQMTPPSLPGKENPGMPGCPDFILITVILGFEHDQNSATFSSNLGEHCGTLCYVQLRSVTPCYIVPRLATLSCVGTISSITLMHAFNWMDFSANQMHLAKLGPKCNTNVTYTIVQCGTKWHNVAQRGITWHNVAQHSTTRCPT